MPLGKTRQNVVYGPGRARGTPHRYTRRRWGIAVAFTLAVAALPLFDLLRFDLWSGRHLYLGRELGLIEVARAFALAFLAINIAIILVTRFAGRYLCGFACPYGAIARLAEGLSFRSRKPGERIAASAALLAACGLLASIAFSFWIDWRVFLHGSPAAISLSGGFLLALFAGLYFLVRRLGLGFCRDWCPSGVYFALLGRDTFHGIEFAHPSSCTDCGACEKACPMDLVPRAMSGGEHRSGNGFYPDGLSSFALCIRCGDCVAACEATTFRRGSPIPLRMGFLPDQARESSEISSQEGAGESTS